MKKIFFKILIALCTIMLFNYNTANYAVANTLDYLRAEKDNIYFYSSQTLNEDSLLFEIPIGYYVKILSRGDYSTFVEYGQSGTNSTKLVGYVKSSDMKECEGISPLYPSLSLTALTQTPIYTRPDQSSQKELTLFVGQQGQFVGYSKGREFAFVSIGGNFGYAPLSNMTDSTVPPHKSPITPIVEPTVTTMVTPSPTITTSTPAPTTTNTNPNDSAQQNIQQIAEPMQILLIVFTTIPLLIIAILLLSPKNSNKR